MDMTWIQKKKKKTWPFKETRKKKYTSKVISIFSSWIFSLWGGSMIKCTTESICQSTCQMNKSRTKTHHKIVIYSIFLIEWQITRCFFIIMQVALKTYFLQCNIWFKYVSSVSTKEKVDLFFGEALEYTMVCMLYLHTCIFH
jgi:hypothetical protein